MVSVFPSGSAVKNLPANVGDAGSILGSGRSPREENGWSFFGCGRKPLFPSTFAGGLKELLRMPMRS